MNYIQSNDTLIFVSKNELSSNYKNNYNYIYFMDTKKFKTYKIDNITNKYLYYEFIYFDYEMLYNMYDKIYNSKDFSLPLYKQGHIKLYFINTNCDDNINYELYRVMYNKDIKLFEIHAYKNDELNKINYYFKNNIFELYNHVNYLYYNLNLPSAPTPTPVLPLASASASKPLTDNNGINILLNQIKNKLGLDIIFIPNLQITHNENDEKLTESLYKYHIINLKDNNHENILLLSKELFEYPVNDTLQKINNITESQHIFNNKLHIYFDNDSSSPSSYNLITILYKNIKTNKFDCLNYIYFTTNPINYDVINEIRGKIQTQINDFTKSVIDIIYKNNDEIYEMFNFIYTITSDNQLNSPIIIEHIGLFLFNYDVNNDVEHTEVLERYVFWQKELKTNDYVYILSTYKPTDFILSTDSFKKYTEKKDNCNYMKLKKKNPKENINYSDILENDYIKSSNQIGVFEYIKSKSIQFDGNLTKNVEGIYIKFSDFTTRYY